MTVIDKDLWMNKTRTAKLTKRTKRGRAYWLTTGTVEEAMAASDFLDKRLIREAGHGAEKVTAKMCPYKLLMGGYYIRNISLQRRRVEIIQNTLLDRQDRSK